MAELASPPTSVVDRSVAAALWAALRTFGRIPGARVANAGDATLILSGTEYANFNNIIATSIEAAAADARIAELLAGVDSRSLPITWWAGPTTRPDDLVARLQRLGLARQEPEFAMSLDLARGWAESALPVGAEIEDVETSDQLDEWLGVMNAAYGWPDARKNAIVRSMYTAELEAPADRRDMRHYLVRLRGRAAACSSLFTGDGQAFVTNIGTRPDARGSGLGSAATVATLGLARALGRTTATLTASLDGRGVYRRLGFVEAGVLERYVATAVDVARITSRERMDEGRN